MSFPRPTKSVLLLATTQVTNGEAYAPAAVDTKGFNHLTIGVHLTTSNNATNKPSVLKLTESDTTDATNYSDITAFVGGGTGGFTIPSASTSTSTPNVYQFKVDLRGRKRYIKLACTPLTTQSATVWAELGKGQKAATASNPSDAGALLVVEG